MNNFNFLVVFKDIVIATAAIVGMWLGVYNYLKARSQEKVKLEVIPKAVLLQGVNSDGKEAHIITPHRVDINRLSKYVAIEVINLSNFSVTIKAAGFVTNDPKKRLTLGIPIIKDGKDWPRKLELRESVTIYGLLEYMLNSPDAKEITDAFVETTCNKYVVGTSNALRDLIAMAA